MYYLGIDIAKHKHDASIIDGTGKLIAKPISFPNDVQGGQALLNWLFQYTDSPSEVLIGMEVTGHYRLAIYSFLLKHNFSVIVLNPIQTNAWRKGAEIRKRKTDKIDATLIADVIRFGRFMETPLVNEKMIALKQLSRFRNPLISNMSDLKRQAIAVLDQTFPEYHTVFSDIFGTTSSKVLMEYTSPSDYEKVSIDDLTYLIETCSRKQLGTDTAKQLKELASQSFGITFCKDAFSFQLKILMEQIKFIEEQVGCFCPSPEKGE